MKRKADKEMNDNDRDRMLFWIIIFNVITITANVMTLLIKIAQILR